MKKEVEYSVIKWRGMDRVELRIWAHLRLDKIEKELGLDNKMPNLEEIANKLESEATEKEAYTVDSESSILPQFITKGFIVAYTSFRHLLNRIFCPNQSKCQNKSADKCKDKTSNV